MMEEFFYYYPESSDPHIQEILTSKKEFYDLASSPGDNRPYEKILFRYQELIKRFLFVYDRLLLMHRTGTGKSCSAFGSSEQFKVTLIKSITDAAELYGTTERTHIKKVYVLTRGKIIIEELKKQLVCKCTESKEYFTQNVLTADNPNKVQKRINKEINKFYIFESFVTFSTKAKENIERTGSYEEYEGSMFIIDEAHILTSTEYDESTGERDAEDELAKELLMKEGKKIRESYDFLHELFHNLKRCKVLLMTATPMINSSSEIAPLMNLLLPLDRQMPTDTDFSSYSIDDLEPYFRGLVSFVRESRLNIEIVREGTDVEFPITIGERSLVTRSKFFVVSMSPRQTRGYIKASNRNFFIDKRQASNFVFPDGSTGIQGFNRYMVKRDNDYYEPNNELRGYLQDINRLSTLSIKFFEIVKLVKEENQSCFVYCDFLKGCGALLLGAVLRSQGFEQFRVGGDIVKPKTASSRQSVYEGYCASAETEIEFHLEQKLRFALITSETPKDVKNNIFKIFNSDANRYGKYIKVIVGSRISRTAINLSNVRQIHILGQAWNSSNTYQAESRGIRATSHVVLLRELGHVQVRIFSYLATLDEEVAKEEKLDPLSDSIDIIMAQTSERKNVLIHRMERVMKSCAIDCQLHYKRNYLPDIDKPGTAENDYDENPFMCFDRPPNFEDESGYRVLYSKKDIEEKRNHLLENFDIENSNGPVNNWMEIREDSYYFNMALQELVNDLTQIKNNFGFLPYLVDDGKYVFSDLVFPLWDDPDISMVYYTENMFIQEQNIFEERVREIQVRLDRKIVETLERTEDLKLVEKLSYSAKVKAFEERVLREIKGETIPKYMDYIYDTFKNYLYVFHEPVKALQEEYERMQQKKQKPGPGRKRIRNIIKVKRLKKPEVKIQGEGEKVYIHTLYGQEFMRTSYTVVSHAFKGASLRILKPSVVLEWRDLKPYEVSIYNMMIQEVNLERNRKMEENMIYGTISKIDGKFRIHDKTLETEATTDARRYFRGKVCENWKKKQLIELLWKLEVKQLTEVNVPDDTVVEELRKSKFDTEQLDMDQMRYYYSWLREGKETICDIIRKTLEERGLIEMI